MNIRVVREAGGLGDIVRIIPVLRGLREQYPQARLWLFVPEEYRPLLAGWYDEFRPTPWEGRRPRDSAIDEERYPYLRADPSIRFDRSISLYCPAFRHEHSQRGEVWLDRIDLFCRAAGVEPTCRTPEVKLDPADTAAAREYLGRRALRPGRGRLIAVQPFSTDPARNWPLGHWLGLAETLEEEGHRVLVLDGCAGRTNAFRQHRVLGQSLGFVAALLKECDLLVAPDSGLGHLAAAVGAPTVGLFASQSPGVMYRHYPRHTGVYPPWDGQSHCRWPCFWVRRSECARDALLRAGRTCPMLGRITVEAALAAVRARLNPAPPPAPIALPALSHAARRALLPVEEVRALPIPRRDFALTRLALVRAVADFAPVLREAYRVLRPGGRLYLSPLATSQALESHGFAACEDSPLREVLTARKVRTWVRAGGADAGRQNPGNAGTIPRTGSAG